MFRFIWIGRCHFIKFLPIKYGLLELFIFRLDHAAILYIQIRRQVMFLRMRISHYSTCSYPGTVLTGNIVNIHFSIFNYDDTGNSDFLIRIIFQLLKNRKKLNSANRWEYSRCFLGRTTLNMLKWDYFLLFWFWNRLRFIWLNKKSCMKSCVKKIVRNSYWHFKLLNLLN